MEELIAKFPEEFFPRKKWVLKDRQKSFAGVGRFDLLFEDEYQTQILMELKAVQARYEDATQLANYKDALEVQGERNVLMWLVAPRIPKAVCEFLDRIGIEYSELHEAEFRLVAKRHGVSLELETSSPMMQSVSEGPLSGPHRAKESGRMNINKIEKAWFHWVHPDGKGFFLAFVNQKGSCSIRFFDAETGAFMGKEYRDGDYQEAFRDYMKSGTQVGVTHQPNLEKVCRLRLPDPVLGELRHQIPRAPSGSSPQS